MILYIIGGFHNGLNMRLQYTSLMCSIWTLDLKFTTIQHPERVCGSSIVKSAVEFLGWYLQESVEEYIHVFHDVGT